MKSLTPNRSLVFLVAVRHREKLMTNLGLIKAQWFTSITHHFLYICISFLLIIFSFFVFFFSHIRALGI